jgi:hypothetical protein
MVLEIGQLDVSDRQLLATKAKPRVSLSREIGEAVVTHTIFGRAKVRIIRKQDQTRRAMWMTALAVTALAAAAWQASRQNEPQQNAEPLPMANTKADSVLASQPESITVPAASPALNGKPKIPVQTETAQLATSQQSAPQAAPSMKVAGQLPAPQAKPAMVQQKLVTVQSPAALATDTGAMKNAMAKPQSPKSLPPKQAAAVAKPLAQQPVTQPAASSPAAVMPLASPIVKEETTPPAGGISPAEPVNPQSK